jgi:hypothetical protein
VIVSIHQPNLMPYSGLADKIARSDIFVVMSQAQYNRSNYQNRFNHGDRWYTLSVNQSLEPLINKKYANHEQDWARIRRQLPEFSRELAEFDACIGVSLVDTNVRILRRMCELLGIKTKIVMDYPSNLTSSARLADLCERYGATTYLSGPSGPAYLSEAPFAARGINIVYQEQVQPRSGLEVIKERLGT